MITIVILAFAAHIIAWLFLPDGKATKVAKDAVRAAHAMQPSGI